jgi:hypothetical protein
MTTDIVLYGNLTDMRRQAANTAVISLLEGSCFLSPDWNKHKHCRATAIKLLGLERWMPDGDEFRETIMASSTFVSQFYCQGAATGCANCGAMVLPGYNKCPDCDQEIDVPTGVLALAEWQTNLTGAALQVAIATHLIAGDLLSYTIHRTTRLVVLRNMLNQSDLDDWNTRAREVRNHILDQWPEGSQPAKDSWEHRFIRISAAFWLVAWPMLKKRFTLEEIDGWNTKMIRAAVVSATKWEDAGANPESYAEIVKAITASEDLDQVAAIRGVSPADMEDEDYTLEEVKPKLFIHPPELVVRGKLVVTEKGHFLGVPISEEEMETLMLVWGNQLIDVDDWMMNYTEEQS